MANQSVRVGIYTPFLHICGGGEKFIGKIAELLSVTHRVEFIVTNDVNLGLVQTRLNVDLGRVGIRRVSSRVPKHFPHTIARYLNKLAQGYSIARASGDYDLFINQETLSSIPCHAGQGVLICQIPPQRFNPNTTWGDNILRLVTAQLLFDSKLRTYDRIVVYSHFVQRLAQNYYHKPAVVLYPPVDLTMFAPLAKKKVILSVGRFFVGTHNKKQLEMIQAFKTLIDEHPELREWEYHLAGGIDPEAEARAYASHCQMAAADYPIQFHFDAPLADLRRLYGEASIFWHAAGLDEDEKRHPERMEHFGITTVEAMAAGCVPVVINRGGQPEIVQHGVNGVCWEKVTELQQTTVRLIGDPSTLAQLSSEAQVRSRDFGVEQFAQRVGEILGL